MLLSRKKKIKKGVLWRGTMFRYLRPRLLRERPPVRIFASYRSVHFNFRGFRLNSIIETRHFREQNHKIEPSFLTYIVPVPGSIGEAQKAQVCFFIFHRAPLSSPSHASCFPFCFSKHQDVPNTNWPFNISGDNPHPVRPF